RHDALDNRLAACIAIQARGGADVAANRTVWANARHFSQFPGPRAEPEVRRGQRAHRANVGSIAAEIRVKWRITGRDDLQTTPALVEAKHSITHEFFLKTCAARALDAAFAIQEDQIPQCNVLIQLHLFVEDETAGAGPILQRKVLERAFAALITDRAVQRVA